MKIGSLMTRNVICVGPNDSLIESFELMRTNGIRHLPVVVENNILVGILSDRDILLRSETDTETGEIVTPDVEVEAAMTKEVITCRASHDMSDIAALMLERKVDAILVTDGLGELTGIITSSDFVELAARRTPFDSGSRKTLPFHFMINRFTPTIRPSETARRN